VPIGGYPLGLALLVPLADRVRPQRLIGGQLSVLRPDVPCQAVTSLRRKTIIEAAMATMT